MAAQITSGLTRDELFQRQVDPALQAQELAPWPNSQKMIADFTRVPEPVHRSCNTSALWLWLLLQWQRLSVGT
ncbi:MAG TPA: hypothetical protein VHZ51_21120 [Ktedonobacteraceae bacterium]|nr:hypothetical protein [Ktedonobacteraceae bacterium]